MHAAGRDAAAPSPAPPRRSGWGAALVPLHRPTPSALAALLPWSRCLVARRLSSSQSPLSHSALSLPTTTIRLCPQSHSVTIVINKWWKLIARPLTAQEEAVRDFGFAMWRRGRLRTVTGTKTAQVIAGGKLTPFTDTGTPACPAVHSCLAPPCAPRFSPCIPHVSLAGPTLSLAPQLGDLIRHSWSHPAPPALKTSMRASSLPATTRSGLGGAKLAGAGPCSSWTRRPGW